MPTVLDEHLVAESLIALTDWSGSRSGIRRTVSLPVGQMEELLSEVAAAADSMNHHPKVDRSGGATTFILWTHSEGGVTKLDFDLAGRIDELVRKVSADLPPAERG